MKEFKTAADFFQKALLSSDYGIRQHAHYNLGNALYRFAEAMGPDRLEDMVPFLEQSIVQYEQALGLNPDDEDAQYNYNFVKHVLDNVHAF
jgi:tetratricopeptide (TPR) repeat protein